MTIFTSVLQESVTLHSMRTQVYLHFTDNCFLWDPNDNEPEYNEVPALTNEKLQPGKVAVKCMEQNHDKSWNPLYLGPTVS